MNIKPGSSGYFSQPVNVLDPHLFDGEHLKPDVRTRLNNLLLNYLNARYSGADSWTMVWLAGSGISYQWSANRGNGDLDVLFGIDYDKFIDCNPDFQWMSRGEITEEIDNDLKQQLWPNTAHELFCTDNEWSYQYYEVTFFLNNNVEASPGDIVNIHPYAAYNLTTDEWTVRPPRESAHINTVYEQHVQSNNEATSALVNQYNSLRSQMSTLHPSSPHLVNLARSKSFIVEQARQLFDTIHLGRKTAFSSQGEGYNDFYNYQWQAAKRDGIVNALNELINGE